MTQILPSILSVVYWVCTIVLCVKGKSKIATPMMLLSLATYPMILGLICQYALSQTFPITPMNYYLLYAISLVVFALFLTSLFIPTSKKDTNIAEQPPNTRWLFLLGGFVAIFVGITVALVFWYSPNTFGAMRPMPMYGVIASNVGSVVAALLFYLAAKYNSHKRPNLMRKIVILSVFLFSNHLPLVLSLILLYAFPIAPSSIFPAEAGVNMISSIIWALLLISLQRKSIIDKPISIATN